LVEQVVIGKVREERGDVDREHEQQRCERAARQECEASQACLPVDG
jgi:hypothetical protein